MITKRTYNDIAVSMAREILDAKKKDFDHLPVDTLHDRIHLWADEVKDDDPEMARTMHNIMNGRKAVMVRSAKKLAEMIIEKTKEENATRWMAFHKIQLFVEMIKRRDSLYAKITELATGKMTQVGWTGWESYVDDYISLRAEAEIIAEYVAGVESLCEWLSLPAALEHALTYTQERIIREASFGTSRSTSQVRNVCEDAFQQARAKILDRASYHGVKPVSHKLTIKERQAEATADITAA